MHAWIHVMLPRFKSWSSDAGWETAQPLLAPYQCQAFYSSWVEDLAIPITLIVTIQTRPQQAMISDILAKRDWIQLKEGRKLQILEWNVCVHGKPLEGRPWKAKKIGLKPITPVFKLAVMTLCFYPSQKQSVIELRCILLHPYYLLHVQILSALPCQCSHYPSRPPFSVSKNSPLKRLGNPVVSSTRDRSAWHEFWNLAEDTELGFRRVPAKFWPSHGSPSQKTRKLKLMAGSSLLWKIY